MFGSAGLQGAVEVVTVAETTPVQGALGLRVLPDFLLGAAPDLDVVVVPGGMATREQRHNDRLIGWIADRAASAAWTMSVCTGAMLLEAAGLLKGGRATTHWAALDELAEQGGDELTVVRGERFVVEGTVATAAGVSAGIDLSLWLVGELLGDETGRAAALFMEYDPNPPYQIADLRGW